jgi:hypothetical protein
MSPALGYSRVDLALRYCGRLIKEKQCKAAVCQFLGRGRDIRFVGIVRVRRKILNLKWRMYDKKQDITITITIKTKEKKKDQIKSNRKQFQIQSIIEAKSPI